MKIGKRAIVDAFSTSNLRLSLGRCAPSNVGPIHRHKAGRTARQRAIRRPTAGLGDSAVAIRNDTIEEITGRVVPAAKEYVKALPD